MATPAEIAAGAAVEILFAVIALGVLYRLWGWFFAVPKRSIVQPFQRGVMLHDGKVEKVLDPGTYWVTPKRRLLLCDVRPTPFHVPAQELLTSDGMAVRISVGGEYRVIDPGSFVTESSDAFGAFYLEARQALRVATGEISDQSFLSGRSPLVARLNELLAPKASQLGIEILRVELYEAIPVDWPRRT